mgnify:CR=1 FL=1
MPKKFLVPVTWMSVKHIEVEAEDFDDAVLQFSCKRFPTQDGFDMNEGVYVEDTFEVDYSGMREV